MAKLFFCQSCFYIMKIMKRLKLPFFAFCLAFICLINPSFSQDYMELLNESVAKKDKAIAYLNSINKPYKFYDGFGELVEVQYLDENDHPVFYKVDNSDAAKLTNATQLRFGGSLGLNLNGSRVKVAIWDGGSVLQNHQELVGRGNSGDAPNSISNHATHVMGTIAASGVNPSAKGMAPRANISYYDFNGDNPEISAAAQNGLILSNHSYGEVVGWNYNGSAWEWFGDADVSAVEDYRFGSYNGSSALWDDISYKNPFYLIVKSAGNDRSDVGSGTGAPQDGPFDTVGPSGCAKNILTVGAVIKAANFDNMASIVPTSFSSWGPTDDGRIKPDIVGVGQGLLSSSSAGIDQYVSLSGTSMSAPNVTGNLVLLQELYKNLNATFMKSATLKGLAIHSAKVAGDGFGPDYRFGWGLMDARAAAEVILTDGSGYSSISENTITAADDYLTFSQTAKANDVITTTICWTDRPGSTEGSNLLDSEILRLVNDLDLRLFRNGEEVAMPYILNPLTKSVSTGDNFRDNVEKIRFVVAEDGAYEIRVSHKGLASNEPQDFALVTSLNVNTSNLKTLVYEPTDGGWNDLSSWKDFQGNASKNFPDSATIVLIGGAVPASMSLANDISLFTLSTLDSTAFKLDLNGHTLSLRNLSLNHQDQSLINGTIVFNNGSNSYLNIPSVNSLQSVSVNIEKQGNGIANISGELALVDLNVISGKVVFDAAAVTLASITLHEGAAMTSVSSTFVVKNSMDVAINTTVNFTDSELHFNGDAVNVTGDFDNVDGTVEINGRTNITGNVATSEFILDGALYLDGSLNLDDVIVYDSSSIIFADDALFELNNNLNYIDFDNTASNIELLANTGKGYVKSNNANKFCVDFFNVTNVDNVGVTKMVLGDASIITNSEGWISDACENILDAKFVYDFACAQGVTKFSDSSDGKDITSRSWTFTLGNEVISSEEENPEIKFNSIGEVEVFLEVRTSQEVSTFSQKISVKQSNISSPGIESLEGILSSTRFSDNYQWYLDGEAIPDSNSPSIEPVASGDYAVEIFNSQCLMRSEPFSYIVTSNKNRLSKKVKVYPVPASTSLYVSSTEDIEVLAIYNLNGSITKEVSFRRLNNGLIELYNLNLQPGFYFIKIRINDNVLSKKILIE